MEPGRTVGRADLKTSPQGRAGLNWQALAHLQEQEEARASRALRVQEAWARGPLRPASPLWTIAVATTPRHPPSGPGTKALCGSLKAGRGRPTLPGHRRTGAHGPPAQWVGPEPAVITGKGWRCICGAFQLPAASQEEPAAISWLQKETKDIRTTLLKKKTL